MVVAAYQFSIYQNKYVVCRALSRFFMGFRITYYLCFFFCKKNKTKQNKTKKRRHQLTFCLTLFHFYIFTYVINDGEVIGWIGNFSFYLSKICCIKCFLHTSAKYFERYSWKVQVCSNLWVNPLWLDQTKWRFGCVWPFCGIRSSRVKRTNLFKL